MRKLRFLAVFVFILVGGFYLFGAWTWHSHLRGTAIPVEEIFESLIASPIPAAVSQLQGARSDAMQGHLAFMRFQAPSLLSAGLTSPPYGPVDCAQILWRFVLPSASKFRAKPAVPTPERKASPRSPEKRSVARS